MAGRDKDTALGAGAVAGAVLTGGSGLGTAAGAEGGAVLGRVITSGGTNRNAILTIQTKCRRAG